MTNNNKCKKLKLITLKPGLVGCTTSGQETDWSYSYNSGAQHG